MPLGVAQRTFAAAIPTALTGRPRGQRVSPPAPCTPHGAALSAQPVPGGLGRGPASCVTGQSVPRTHTAQAQPQEDPMAPTGRSYPGSHAAAGRRPSPWPPARRPPQGPPHAGLRSALRSPVSRAAHSLLRLQDNQPNSILNVFIFTQFLRNPSPSERPPCPGPARLLPPQQRRQAHLRPLCPAPSPHASTLLQEGGTPVH